MAKQVTQEEVVERLTNGEEVNVIDIRESSEVASGKIPGAKHIPLGQLVLRQDELEKEKRYIITCQTGNRSKAASGILEALGYKVEDMIGGMNNWQGETE
ncbi:rhodanese-like domain-containing protein [Ornithinibacillus bavariensis]|uniref:Rhodanese-like domain-containing protein n=1 Tax=Ornithinibacillus bavariensis TaxID=545502 RepID=A0A919X6M2_9BACI|nr:rhodanese-like domain-containing protein [Ornithinibacillus bavariensis]GIO26901.1 rhodanese-like domain-containing protein [Ornithinibacillus bavariensis]HAM80655.1 sulfurtransferase [Ornithinibacillus sp.]